MKRLFYKFGMLLLMVLSLTPTVVADQGAEIGIQLPLQLTGLIEEGLANNQEIRGLEALISSYKEEISFAGSLSDPRIGIGTLNVPTDSFSFNQEPMTQKQIFVAQKVPWFGKLSLQSQQAAVKAIRQEAILKAKKLELVRQIATAYYDLGFIAGSQMINKRMIDLLDQILRISETRYASGQGLQQDVLQAQVELGKLLEEQASLSNKRRILEDRINGLLNREKFMSVTPPEDLPYPDMKLIVEKLQNRALEMNPQLQIRQAEIDQAVVEEQLARKDYWPDMDFIVAYGQRDESKMGQDWSDFVSTSVVMNVPLWQKNRQDKKLAATQSRRQAALRSYQNLKSNLPHQIDALISDIQTIQKNYQLITDALMIQAGQWAQSSLAAYKVGKVEFNTMINAQIRLLRLENQALNYLYGLYGKHAELQEILGAPPLSSSGDTDRAHS